MSRNETELSRTASCANSCLHMGEMQSIAPHAAPFWRSYMSQVGKYMRRHKSAAARVGNRASGTIYALSFAHYRR